MNKPTTIRGTKLVPGDKVYWTDQWRTENPTISFREIKATSGTSFAFARKGFNFEAKTGAWAWVEEPEVYCVTLEEAQATLIGLKGRSVVELLADIEDSKARIATLEKSIEKQTRRAVEVAEEIDQWEKMPSLLAAIAAVPG